MRFCWFFCGMLAFVGLVVSSPRYTTTQDPLERCPFNCWDVPSTVPPICGEDTEGQLHRFGNKCEMDWNLCGTPGLAIVKFLPIERCNHLLQQPLRG